MEKNKFRTLRNLCITFFIGANFTKAQANELKAIIIPSLVSKVKL